MRATPQERHAFGQQLSAALEAAGMSQAALRSRLEMEHGILKSATAVSNWAKGVFAPDRKTTAAIDSIVGTGGLLLTTLGYASAPEAMNVETDLSPEHYAWIATLDAHGRKQLESIITDIAWSAARASAIRIMEALNMDVAPGMFDAPDDESFAVAADEGSPDPHDDEVGPATGRHPGGAEPTADTGA